jgi:hypothetical protein
MTCSLYWKPESIESNRVGGIALREILEKKYGYPYTLSYGHLDYLEALRDANVDGAEDLIEAIRQYGEIKIFKVC